MKTWLKGGIIGLIFAIVLFIFGPSNEPSFFSLPIFLIWFVSKNISNFLLGSGLGVLFCFLVYTLLGALIGWIIGRNKK